MEALRARSSSPSKVILDHLLHDHLDDFLQWHVLLGILFLAAINGAGSMRANLHEPVELAPLLRRHILQEHSELLFVSDGKSVNNKKAAHRVVVQGLELLTPLVLEVFHLRAWPGELNSDILKSRTQGIYCFSSLM